MMTKPKQWAPNCAVLLTIIIASLFASGCDKALSSPKIIVADGQTYLACKDMVWVDSEGGSGETAF